MQRRRPLLGCFFMAALLISGPGGEGRPEVDVDLELVLAVDISRSMDLDEQKLQREGYVAALNHPEVLQAIASGPIGRIAVTYVEWAGPFHQATVVPWMVVSGRREAAAFTDRIRAAPLLRETGTSISGGLLFSASLVSSRALPALRAAPSMSRATGRTIWACRSFPSATGSSPTASPSMACRSC